MKISKGISGEALSAVLPSWLDEQHFAVVRLDTHVLDNRCGLCGLCRLFRPWSLQAVRTRAG